MANFLTKLFGSGEQRATPSIGHKEPALMETLFTALVVMLTELYSKQQDVLVSLEKMQLAKRIENLGFTKSYAVAEKQQLDSVLGLLRFMIEMWRDLGPNTLLIKDNQFLDLLRQYDLMCVNFDAYTGDIPYQNLQEIERIHSKLETLRIHGDDRYARKLLQKRMYVKSSGQLLDMIRLPFSCWEELYRFPFDDEIRFDFSPEPKGRMFIAAPKDCVVKPNISLKRYHRNTFEREQSNNILYNVKAYANVSYTPEPKPLSLNYDPFICSLCDYGVIIHSMWGPEAQSATINRYQQLRDAIIQQGIIP